MKSAQHYDKIQRVRIKDKEVEAFVPAYQVRLLSSLFSFLYLSLSLCTLRE
jgi:hypothetical protein